MTDWGAEIAAWLEARRSSGAVTPSEEAAAREFVEAVGSAPPDSGTGSDREEWAYLRRWPIEMRLGVARILSDLGVEAALRAQRPGVHAALYAELRGDPQG